MKSSKTYVFKILDDFQCIGPDCEASCCDAGWRICFDKKSFENTQKRCTSIDYPIEKGIDANTQINGDFLIKNNKNRCSFLEKDQLCGLYKALDVTAMPSTCRTYPRKIKSSHGKKEISAVLSCPEIARLFLKDANSYQIHHDQELASLFDKSNFSIENLPQYSRLMERLRSFLV